jgi:MFS family permease
MRLPRHASDLSLAFRLALVSFLFNLALFASLIFLPLYASDLGASKFQVGLIAAAYGMAYFVSATTFGRQSDIRGRMIFIRSGLVLASAAYFLQTIAPNPIVLLLIRAAIGFCLGVSAAALMAYVYESAGRVGSFTSFGSLGWLCGSIAAAILRDYEGLFILSAVGAAVAFVISLTLKDERHTRVQVATLPLGIVWANRRVYLPFLLRHMGATSVWAILPLYLAGIGASPDRSAIQSGAPFPPGPCLHAHRVHVLRSGH